MAAKQHKKLLIMNILDILRKYTDENHRLSQRDITEILETEYNMKADRKAIKRNLMNLLEFGYNIEYSETVRMVPIKDTKTGEALIDPDTGKPQMEESCMLSDFYLEREFTDSELRLLIDGLLFSKHIPYSQCKELVEKLEGLSNCYFRSRVKHIRSMPDNSSPNAQLFMTIEVLDEAISKGRQVAFYYNEYRTDKKKHPRCRSDGSIRRYIINPYQMVAANGKYYLICNYDKSDQVSNYRLDRISDIELLDTPVKPMKQVDGLRYGLDLPKHMAEHIYMFAGESVMVTFRAKKYIINEVIDWLGRDIDIIKEDDDTFTAKVRMNYEAMRCWALQYARHVRVLSPERLVEQIKNDLKQSMDNYSD